MISFQGLMMFILGSVFGGVVIFIADYLKNKKLLKKINNLETLENVIASMPGHVYWLNTENVYLGCNNQQAQSLGLTSREEIVGKRNKDFADYATLDSCLMFDRVNEEIMSTGLQKTIEESEVLHDGKEIIFLSNKTPLFDKNGNVKGILGVSIDLTETRKKEMERLRFLENIIALMPEHIYWKDKNGVILGCNDTNARNAGLSCAADMVGKTDYDLFSKEEADALRLNDQEIINTGKAKIVEEPRILPNGETALFLSHKIPLRNENNQVIGILGISIDITEKKLTEQKLVDAQHKLEAMTTLSSAIAHELRTPLRAIGASASSLKDYMPTLLATYREAKNAKMPVPYISPVHQKSLDPLLEVIELETQSAMTVIEMLLIRLNQEGGDKELVRCSMKHCLGEALSRYPFDTGERELVHWDRDSGPDFYFKGNELLVVHIFFNLLKNALYYIKAVAKGEIHIWFDLQNEINRLYFKDTGAGISADILPRIFEQFFSRTHHGAGVGLSFCKTVMHSFGGDITCQSIEGEYTEFMLSFPIMRDLE